MTYKKLLILWLMALPLFVSPAGAQGIPFLRNYTAKEYNAHNRNFDIEIDDNGTVYVANFEGLMYYDNAEWRIIHTPSITRVTVVYCDEENIVWVGGYNYFGRIERKVNGNLYLQRVGKADLFRGEVEEIYEANGSLNFLAGGNVYKVEGNQVTFKKQVSEDSLALGLSDIVQTEALEKENKLVVLDDVTQMEPLENGLNAVVKKGAGIAITDEAGKTLYSITEKNGLCNDNVVWIAYNGHGLLWGATDNGLFSIAIPSIYSRFTPHEGLMGEVLSIEEFEGKMYAGTNTGLFRMEGKSFVEVPGVSFACWQLSKTDKGLMAATAEGVYLISANGNIKQLTYTGATSLLDLDTQLYTGEMDGVYLTQTASCSRKKVCNLEKVTKILKDKQGNIWLQNLYGEIWSYRNEKDGFRPYKSGASVESAKTIVELVGNKLAILDALSTKPFPYPLFSYLDDNGVTWLTNGEGKALYRWKNGKTMDDLSRILYPLRETTVSALFCQDNKIWIGSDEGLTVIDTKQQDPFIKTKPHLFFRSVWLGTDSLLWGGFGDMPKGLLHLESNERHLRFTYAIDYIPLMGKTLYRYKLNNGNWTAWADDNDAEFVNLPHGSYTLMIQALTATGDRSEIVSISFDIAYPFYQRWYMWLLYAALLALVVYFLVQLRLRRLEKEKLRLEKVIKDRTAEVVKQKDEIEEKSKSLETALTELHQAQGELIRQEKMATAGKLTQGLIDRILNPLNYINNFSKLSEGLVKDVEANIEDEKDNMDSENYEDTIDVLDMLRGNLQKVSEHGQNTTRTLKAMEEMLKDRSGGIVPMNFVTLLRQDEEMMLNYYADDIKKYGIKISFDCPDEEISMNGNAEQLSKTIMSLLSNSVYALVKKAQRQQFKPEVSVSVRQSDSKLTIVIRDNGIGIEPTIINKIYDPFFTTKPTGEAAGVGLYLSREIIQNHNGDISVQSMKNDYTEFTITLPTL